MPKLWRGFFKTTFSVFFKNIWLISKLHRQKNKFTVEKSNPRIWCCRIQWSRQTNKKNKFYPEPITSRVQLPHVPVTAFSQTDLFLVWIYRPQARTQYFQLTSSFHPKIKSTWPLEVAIFFLTDALISLDRNWLISRSKCKITVT